MALSQFDHGLAGGRLSPGNQNAADTSPGSPFQHGLPVGVEFVQVQMAMGIGRARSRRHIVLCQVSRCPVWHTDTGTLDTDLLKAGDLQAILQDGLHLIAVHRLAIDAHDRFGAGEADQHPAAIFELELETVHGDEVDHFQPADGLRVGIQDHLFPVGMAAAEGTVDAVVRSTRRRPWRRAV